MDVSTSPQPTIPTPLPRIEHPDLVYVTGADYNGSTFDGSPFSWCPDWLVEAVQQQLITIEWSRDKDYSDFGVVNADGVKVIAQHGDYIWNDRSALSVLTEAEARIQFNAESLNDQSKT